MEIQPCTDRRQSLLNLKQQSSGPSGNSQIPFLGVANPVPPNLQSAKYVTVSVFFDMQRSAISRFGAQSIWNVCGFESKEDCLITITSMMKAVKLTIRIAYHRKT